MGLIQLAYFSSIIEPDKKRNSEFDRILEFNFVDGSCSYSVSEQVIYYLLSLCLFLNNCLAFAIYFDFGRTSLTFYYTKIVKYH